MRGQSGQFGQQSGQFGQQSGQFGQLFGKTLFYTLPLQRSNTDSMYLFLDDVGENGRSGGESPNRHGEPKTKKFSNEYKFIIKF